MNLEEIIDSKPWAMFTPGTKADLLTEYPELRSVEAFMQLSGSPKKMLFVYYYGSKMSRGRELVSDEDRITFAIRMAWGAKPPKEIMETYPVRKWGKDVSAAIHAMAGYEPEPRIAMKLTCMKLIGRVKALLDIPPPPDASDYNMVSKYFSMLKDGMALMDTLTPMTEHAAFGVTEKRESTLREEEGAIMEILNS